ncbi:MAG: hypothetical protein IPM59_01125 [Chloracidobacterium sp.]|nr:hypothetical protein [Chloracidobacterium sp.]
MPQGRNFIGEWFGHRIFPTIKASEQDISDFLSHECPFLSQVLRESRKCVKSENSLGVCTITTTTVETKDWMVCPYRSLDLPFLNRVARRLFAIDGEILVYPVVSLAERINELKEAYAAGVTPIVFFQDKLGGEINLSATPQSPELSFDITLVPLRFVDDEIRFRKFGIYEVQTMDFHGSYRHAVTALRNAVDLHQKDFTKVLAANPEWMGRNIEGPNIANVFKRTFYQLVLKFRLAGHGECEGVALGLPAAVWDSWAPHLNAPVLVPFEDYFVLEGTEPGRLANSWIYVFETETASEGSRESLGVRNAIRVDVGALLANAFNDVPEYITTNLITFIHQSILSRMKQAYPQVELDDRA